MNVIRILSEKVASQIAAGEVVDRPASVVRELVDNSVDAGADRIVITIENGGKRLIKVTDNGVGMSRDDLLLCVERHATSKISTASDLLSIKSLGFRGEAIPSIASVSRMQIISRPQERLVGHRLRVEGGNLMSIEETGTPAGTIAEVRDLFFNLPARRKFLRAVKTETDHIVDSVSRAALPLPRIGFKLEDGGKTILNFPASEQQLPRLFTLMGRKATEALIEANERNDDLSIRAYLAPSEMSRSRGDRLFIYVNGRNIRDRLVTRAVLEGYGQRLMKGQYPQAVVFMEMDQSKVDVNVHPTKQEVRFHDSRAVFRSIISAVEKAFSQSSYDFLEPIPRRARDNIAWKQGAVFLSEPTWGYSQAVQDDAFLEKPEADRQATIEEGPEIIGQLRNTYILCQLKNGLLMVDQHAAHERIVYEGLKKGIDAAQVETQSLLLPYKVELTNKEKRIALEKKADLSRFGFELDHFGGNTFLLRSHPAILQNAQWDQFLPELLAQMESSDKGDSVIMDKVLTVVACHGAIRAGQRLTRDEMVQLLSQLGEMDIPTNCPHGRPVFKHFDYNEIEKMFRRVV